MALTDSSTSHSCHIPQKNSEAQSGAGICMSFPTHQQLHRLPDGRSQPPAGTAATQDLPSRSLPCQQSKKPALAHRSRSGSQPLAQGSLCRKWDKPSRKAGWSRIVPCLSGKGWEKQAWEKQAWEKPCMTKVVPLYLQQPRTSRVRKGRACTPPRTGSRYLLLPPAFAGCCLLQRRAPRFSRQDPAQAIASIATDPRGDSRKVSYRISTHTSQGLSCIYFQEIARVYLRTIPNYSFIYSPYQPKPGFSSPAFSFAWGINSSPSHNTQLPDISPLLHQSQLQGRSTDATVNTEIQAIAPQQKDCTGCCWGLLG